jgi:hypothetical protein
MTKFIHEHGTALVTACLARIFAGELLMSSVECLADILHSLLVAYPTEVNSIVMPYANQSTPLAAAMREVANRRRFREFIKKSHMEARRAALLLTQSS